MLEREREEKRKKMQKSNEKVIFFLLFCPFLSIIIEHGILKDKWFLGDKLVARTIKYVYNGRNIQVEHLESVASYRNNLSQLRIQNDYQRKGQENEGKMLNKMLPS